MHYASQDKSDNKMQADNVLSTVAKN